MKHGHHILYAVTDAMTAAAFLKGHLEYNRAMGHRVSLIAPPGPSMDSVASETGVDAIRLHMNRQISPTADLKSLWHAVRILRDEKPTAAHVGTPKAGLIVGLACWVARVPVRVYTVHGLRYQGLRGRMRTVVRWTEMISCWAATDVVAVSESVKQVLVNDAIVRAKKVRVLGAGSIAGVDPARYAVSERDRQRAARSWRIDPACPTVLFVGRLGHDKGIAELAAAWGLVLESVPTATLLLVGAPDPTDPLDPSVLARLRREPSIVMTGHLDDPSVAYALADILVLPSHREGFGNVVLEAASVGKPAVVTRVTGCVDAVIDGVTGLIVAKGSASGIAAALSRMLVDHSLREEMGRAARERVINEFNPVRLFQAYLELCAPDSERPA